MILKNTYECKTHKETEEISFDNFEDFMNYKIFMLGLMEEQLEQEENFQDLVKTKLKEDKSTKTLRK